MKAQRAGLFLLVLGLGGCDDRGAEDSFDRHIAVCSMAESNGLPEAAARACGAALAIAEKQGYAPALISGLLYRLGRLERQRGRFREAELLVTRSLTLEEHAGNSEVVAIRLIELSLSLAGQGQWLDGAQLLERAAPLVDAVTGPDRKAAADSFRAYAVRLAGMGHTAQAEQFKVKAEELAEF